jgi:hypothetical protein
MTDKTKHETARDVAEKSGLDPDNPDYVSEGGTVTKDFYRDVAEAHGADVPEDANKDEVADIAVEAVGGDPNNTRTSAGGTETKSTLNELDRATDDND